MDDKGRLIIPAELRKDGKPFIGETFEETKVMEESASTAEGNRHDRRVAAAIARKTKELEEAIHRKTTQLGRRSWVIFSVYRAMF